MADTQSRYFPIRSDYSTHQQWQDMVNVHTQLYAMQDAAAKPAAPETPAKPEASPTGPSSTHVVGIPVSGSPQHGQKLTYDGPSGQLIWT